MWEARLDPGGVGGRSADLRLWPEGVEGLFVCLLLLYVRGSISVISWRQSAEGA